MSDILLRAPVDQFFTRAKSGVVWGRLYFEFGGTQFFPEANWTDMVIAFELAWLRALLNLARGSSASERVWFLDGPFAVDISLKEAGVAELDFIHKEVVRAIETASIKSLLETSISTAKDSLSACSERRWSDADTEALAALLKGISSRAGATN